VDYDRAVMRAVVLPSFHAPLELEERPVPAARDGEVLVRVLACGVCHSDLHVADGYFSSSPLPLVLGHEIAGELESGERALVYTPWGCGECRFCLATEEMICPDGKEAGMFQDGGYAEYVRVPARRFIYPIGDLDPVQAAPLGCGGLTPYRAVKHARPWLGPGSRALVLGAGGLGQFGIQYLRLLTDAAVHAADPSAQKRARALELGAEAVADRPSSKARTPPCSTSSARTTRSRTRRDSSTARGSPSSWASSAAGSRSVSAPSRTRRTSCRASGARATSSRS
jgi:propanol-preferring alcohol dehydrogenase